MSTTNPASMLSETSATPRPTPALSRRGALRPAHLGGLALGLALGATSGLAQAAPEAHLLRIDPRASLVDGAPVLTTVVEVVQNKRLSEITGACATTTGDANLDCVANALEQPQALYSPFKFVEQNAVFTVNVDGTDTPASFLSKSRWGEEAPKAGTGAGTAWLILLDAGSSMGTRVADAKAVASAFVETMGPNDIVDVMVFNDRAVVNDSRWVATKAKGLEAIGRVGGAYPAQGRSRPLGTILKNAITDGFKELGNAGTGVKVPLHQALVVLSSGSAGTDPGSNALTSNILRDYLTKGRFPENNEVLPKTPVPTISVWFPAKQVEEFTANAREFMEGLANTEIGGFYSLVRTGQAARAGNIVRAVRTRFDQMHVVKWRVSCVAPTVTQTFKLFFTNTQPPIAGDATFQNVPVGIDPSSWPLDIDREATERAAQKDPIYPGGKVKVFGNFCWGGNPQRAEVYLVPKNQPIPASLEGAGIEEAKKAQQALVKAGMHKQADMVGATVAEFTVPDDDAFLVGGGDAAKARLIVVDNQARRSSPATADKILTLSARSRPFPFLLVAGGTFGAVVLGLLVMNLLRGGGKGRTRPVTPPSPVGPAAGPQSPATAASRSTSRVTLDSSLGSYTLTSGSEVRVGRATESADFVLAEPRVSSFHATLRLANGQLEVQDEGSNNGTWLDGTRLAPRVWTPVRPGSTLKVGPVDLDLRFE